LKLRDPLVFTQLLQDIGVKGLQVVRFSELLPCVATSDTDPFRTGRRLLFGPSNPRSTSADTRIDLPLQMGRADTSVGGIGSRERRLAGRGDYGSRRLSGRLLCQSGMFKYEDCRGAELIMVIAGHQQLVRNTRGTKCCNERRSSRRSDSGRDHLARRKSELRGICRECFAEMSCIRMSYRIYENSVSA
jgi:hypothetical protein